MSEANKMLEEIGERLRKQRKIMGLTQEQTAELLEISQTYYGEIERGNRRLSIERILMVYDKMGLDPTYLLTGEEQMSTEALQIVKECPKDKRSDLNQILLYLSKLYS